MTWREIMTNKLKVVTEDSVEPFDRLTLNADHRIDFEDGELTAAYPENADETEYQVALFPTEDGGVELPDGSAVLSVGESVVALVPTEQYEVSK
jgi:hypothetical protein